MCIRDRLESYMYDLEWARRQGVRSTGNGRRQSFQFHPIPRMSNTYLASGETPPAEIIAQTDHGLLVKRMGGGQVNPTTGDFVFDVAEGYLIEKGRVSYPVRGATLSGNGPRGLLAVDLVGTDLGFGHTLLTPPPRHLLFLFSCLPKHRMPKQ